MQVTATFFRSHLYLPTVDLQVSHGRGRRVELLRAPEAARRLGVPTQELLRLVRERQIRYLMVNGIAHIPDDAVEEYRAKAS
jgi:excisionase family DNA binding protein